MCVCVCVCVFREAVNQVESVVEVAVPYQVGRGFASSMGVCVCVCVCVCVPGGSQPGGECGGGGRALSGG